MTLHTPPRRRRQKIFTYIMNLYHWSIRISTEKEKATEWINKMEELFEPKSQIWSFEKGKQTEQPHIHGYLVSARNWKNDRAKQRAFNKCGLKGNGCYSCTLVKNNIKYVAYLTKELDIIKNENVEAGLLDKAAKYKSMVQESMKKSTVFEKIEVFVKHNQLELTDKYSCQVAVMKFYMSMGEVPRHQSMLIYLSNKLYLKANPKSTAENLLYQLYGIQREEKVKSEQDHLNDTLTHLMNKQQQLEEELNKYTLLDYEDLDSSESLPI